MEIIKNLILGAGITGVSASYHIGHDKCLLLEKSDKPLGVLKSKSENGFTWDQGPHISFTKHDYVKGLFQENVGSKYEEFAVSPINYFYGLWLDHPIQSNLYQLPSSLKSQCVKSFLKERKVENNNRKNIKNYYEWCKYSLGEKITAEFIQRYTKKYWTVEAEKLGIDWIGPRVHVPDTEALLAGAMAKPKQRSHYINKVRYPKVGGYQSFVKPMLKGANVLPEHSVNRIDLHSKKIFCTNGKSFKYQNLISTLPLPIFVSLCTQLTAKAKKASTKLRCTKLLLVNIELPHKVPRSEQWLYIYDDNMLSTRITIMDNLSQMNAPLHQSGVQVEVYFTDECPLPFTDELIGKKVIEELKHMGLIKSEYSSSNINFHTQRLDYANIIFDHRRSSELELIYSELENYGLIRYQGDLDALTDWNKVLKIKRGPISLLGRYGEWKYYWSDDCIMAGKALSQLSLE